MLSLITRRLSVVAKPPGLEVITGGLGTIAEQIIRTYLQSSSTQSTVVENKTRPLSASTTSAPF